MLRSLLLGMIPALSGALDSGTFHEDMKLKALGWATDVGRAALAEGYDGSHAITALMALSGAQEFEMQQLGLTAALGFCDALLEEVTSNAPPSFAPVQHPVDIAGIIAGMRVSTRNACNSLTLAPKVRQEMIASGAALERLVKEAVSQGARPAGDADLARRAYEGIAEVATCPFQRREIETGKVLDAIALLAA